MPKETRSRAEIGEQWRSELLMVYIIADAIRNTDLADMEEALDRAQAVAPLFNPSAWLEHGDKVLEDAAVVRILARAKRDLDRLPWPKRKAVAEPNRNENATTPEGVSGVGLEVVQ